MLLFGEDIIKGLGIPWINAKLLEKFGHFSQRFSQNLKKLEQIILNLYHHVDDASDLDRSVGDLNLQTVHFE